MQQLVTSVPRMRPCARQAQLTKNRTVLSQALRVNYACTGVRCIFTVCRTSEVPINGFQNEEGKGQQRSSAEHMAQAAEETAFSTEEPHKSMVDEEHMPGYHHESREDLAKKGAVVHEELLPGRHGRPHFAGERADSGTAAGDQETSRPRRTKPEEEDFEEPPTATGPGWTMRP